MMEPLLSTCTVVRESGISTRQLYYWEMIGLVRPRYETFGMRRFRRYTISDLNLVRRAKELLDEGFTLDAVRRRLLTRDEGREDDGRKNRPSSFVHHPSTSGPR